VGQHKKSAGLMRQAARSHKFDDATPLALLQRASGLRKGI
jgi:hypothetical protein